MSLGRAVLFKPKLDVLFVELETDSLLFFML